MLTTLARVKRAVRRLIDRDRPIILMYHRVARLNHDPWRLAVSPDNFAGQIDALLQLRHVVPLRWLADQIARGRLPKNVAAVTFDDGYVDLLTEAKPVLERYGCPATAFLVTGVVGIRHAFWWDELSRLVFETPTLPMDLEITIGGQTCRWQIGGRAANDRSPGLTREELHIKLWQVLRPQEPALRQELVLQLCRWAGIEVATNSPHRPLSAPEVRRFAAPGFIDIGAHSVTHPVLPTLDSFAQRAEIEGSRAACEALIGVPIDTFAYPHGAFDDTTAACVRNCGVACACTTRARAVSAKDDPVLLPRLHIENWSGTDFARKLAWGF